MGRTSSWDKELIMLRYRKRRWIRRNSSAQSVRHEKRQRAIRRLIAEPLENRILLTTVTGVTPLANSHNAAVSTDISATFDQNITAATDQNFVVHSAQGGRLVGGATSVSTSGTTAAHDPTNNLFPGERVQATVTGGLATAGGPEVWQFRTAVGGGLGTFVASGQSIGIAAENDRNLGLEVGDLDGDGDLDIFMASANYRGSKIFLNDGGTFTNSGQSLGLHFARDVSLGDLDGDGDLDAVMANDSGQANIVWQNNGSGIFSEFQTFGSQGSREVRLGDLDGDGDLDAFVANVDGGDRAYLNDGSGSFSATGSALGSDPSTGVDLADVDSDGDLDAFVVSGGSSPTGVDRVWLNNGSGAFTDSGQSLGPGPGAGVRLADLDGDGDLDAYVTEFDEPNLVYFNNGSGVFTDSGQSITDPLLTYPRSLDVKLGDLDADGDLDAFVANSLRGGNRVYLNDGAGVFSNSGQILGTDAGTVGIAAGNTYAVALGDMDGDGDLDAVTANDNNLTSAFSVGRIWVNQNPATSVSLSVDSATIAEAAGVATVTATLSGTHTQEVTVDLGFGGTAADPADYTVSGSQIVIPVGATSGSITITANQDADDEPDETVIVDISSVTGASESGVQQVTTTILDDDEAVPVPDVTLTVDNAAIPEEAGVAMFTATLSEVTTVAVTIDLSILGTADATDFSASGTQIVVPPGDTTGSITVTAVQDTDDEPDETVIVDITNVVGGTEAGTQQQTTTITDDDEPPVPDVTLSVDNASIAEAGGVAIFTATLTEATTISVTVSLQFTGTAASGDYTVAEDHIRVPPGATTGSLAVTAVDDTEDESDETVIVDISAVAGGNESGTQQQTTTITDDDDPPRLTVTNLTETESGFVAGFATDLNTSLLNLYDTQSGGLGPADVVLQGAAVGPVAGSLVIDPSLRQVTFIKSGDPLGPDTYTVTLRSAADGFADAGGQLLDGNDDGTEGDDYSSTFEVAEAAANTVTIGISDIVRGPGQDVNLPADETNGIPVTMSGGANIRAVDMRVAYDPDLLTISGATVGADAPAGASVIANTTTPGLAILVFFSTNPLPDGGGTFINLEASVPATDASGIYGAQQVLDVHEVVVSDGNDNESPVVVDDAFQLTSFFADVSGNGRINAADASGVARIAALIDGGFAGSPNADPSVVGDISGNGRLNAADASLLAQFAALIDVPQIPPIPGGVVITWLPSTSFGTEGSSGEPQRATSPQISGPANHSSQDSTALGTVLGSLLDNSYSAVDRAMADLSSSAEGNEAEPLLSLEDAVDELLSAGDGP
jgi:hypothetical protein